jgi:hypothetical protein
MVKTVVSFIPSIGKKGFGESHGKVNSAKNGFGKGQKEAKSLFHPLLSWLLSGKTISDPSSRKHFPLPRFTG